MLETKWMRYSFVAAAVIALSFTGCSEDEESQSAKEELKKSQVAQKAQELGQSIKEAAVETKDEVKEVVQKSKEEVKEAAQEVKTKALDTTDKVLENVAQALPAATKSGEEIYKTCISCHGAKAEKVAMGKSKVIQGWESSKIVEALQGYKDGSYGGVMKGVMKGQASKLTQEEMQAVAEYISKL